MIALALLLVLLGAILVAAEAHVPTHGVLGSGAVLSFALGIGLLLAAAGTAALAAGAVSLLIAAGGAVWVGKIVKEATATRRLTAKNGIVGRVGVARAADRVFVDGALWRAHVWDLEEEPPLERGDHIVVEHVNGLTLTVRHAETWEVA